MIKKYDITIVGSGMVGQSLALLLAQHDFSIAIIEKNAAPADISPAESVDHFSARVSAITPYSKFLMEKIQAWSAISQKRFCPYHDMQVWEENGTSELHFKAHEIAESDLGYIIENTVINKALSEQVADSAAIDCYFEQRIEKIQVDEQHASLQLSNQQIIYSDLLVGADGALSFVRNALNMPLKQRPIGQSAIVCTIKTEHPHSQTALQRFTNSGPLAFLPLQNETENLHFHSIVWSCPDEAAQNWLNQPVDHFIKALEKHCPNHLGAISDCSTLQAYPLINRHADEYIQNRAILIGDAAHTVHPLAGQGVNLGFLDSATLAEELIKAKRNNIDIFDDAVFKRFERRRRWHNKAMQESFNLFNKVYLIKNPLFSLLRNQGVKLVSSIEPLRRLLVMNATGKLGDVPFKEEL